MLSSTVRMPFFVQDEYNFDCSLIYFSIEYGLGVASIIMNILFPLIFMWLSHFVVDFMLGIWSVYKTMSALDLGVAGLAAAFCAFMGEGAQFAFGNLSDRGYRKRLILLGVLLTAANVLLAFTTHYGVIVFLLLLTCIGSGAFHPSAVALIGGLTDRRKGLYIAIFASGGALGMAFSQMIFAKMHLHFEGNTLPLLLPTAFLVLALACCGFFKKEDMSIHGVRHIPFGWKMFRDYFKDHTYRMLYITQVCNQTIFWATIFLLPDVLVSRGYSDTIAYGGGHMAFIIGSVFTMIPSGYFADRFSARNVIVISSLVGMIFFFALLMMPLLSPFYVILLLIGAGSLIGIVQPVAVALGTDLGRKNPGAVSAFTMGLVWCVSETMGPAGAGLLTKLFVEDAPAKALMVLGLLFPLMLYAAARLPRSVGEPELAIASSDGLE